MDRRGIFLGLAFTSLVVASAACSSSGGTGSTAPRPSPSPTGVVLGTLGNVNCTAANNAVPGTYASIESYGSVAGTTYTQYDDNESGFYETASYTAGATSAPTIEPNAPPSVPPTSPNAVLAIVYYGEYNLPITPGLTTAATNGCFVLDTANVPENEFSTVRRSSMNGRRVSDASPSPSPSPFTGYGFGLPAFAPPYPTAAGIVDGTITTFTITDLTRTTGTGTFTLNTAVAGNSATATGTAVITGSTAFYYTADEGDAFQRRALHFHRR